MDALVIDDSEPNARAIEWALRKIMPDWDVQRTSDAVAGGYLLILDPALRLAVVDYFMPIKDGEAIVTEAIKVRPQLLGKIIICSGLEQFPEQVEQHLFVDLRCQRIRKPVDFEVLERLVHQIID